MPQKRPPTQSPAALQKERARDCMRWFGFGTFGRAGRAKHINPAKVEIEAQAPLTAEQLEYARYAKAEKAAGRRPMPPAIWMRRKRPQSATAIIIAANTAANHASQDQREAKREAAFAKKKAKLARRHKTRAVERKLQRQRLARKGRL